MSIFGFLILGLVGIIAFFHYIQGFFSAAISAIIAVIAAAMAMGYQETFVNSFLQGKFADQANAMALVVIFAVTYFILRVIFDWFIPGNIRLPVMMDKVGAGVMGLIAGIFGAGIVAIAAQSMPFPPAIAGYSRYVIGDEREVVVPAGQGQRSAQDSKVSDELKNDKFEPADAKSMVFPVDDMVVNTVAYMSNDGSLAGDANFASVHPSYLDELFGNRLGIQTGAKRTAMNITGHDDVKVDGVFSLDLVAQTEGEVKELRTASPKKGKITPSNSQILLVVRTLFSRNATDSDGIFRFSPGSVRLEAGGKDFYPIGTLNEKGNLMFANRMDDFLFVEIPNDDRGADLVFLLDRKDVLADAKSDKPELAPGTFIEVKRLARVDLSGHAVVKPLKPGGEKVAVMRKPDVIMASGTAMATNAPLVFQSVEISPKLFNAVNVGKPESDGADVQLNSGLVSFKDRKFTKMNMNTTDTLALLGKGYTINELAEPAGKKIVQVKCTTPGKTDLEAWNWSAALGDLELMDEAGTHYKMCGALAMAVQKGRKAMVGLVDVDSTVSSFNHSNDDGRAQDVYLFYAVPSGTHLTQFIYQGKQVSGFQQVVQ